MKQRGLHPKVLKEARCKDLEFRIWCRLRFTKILKGPIGYLFPSKVHPKASNLAMKLYLRGEVVLDALHFITIAKPCNNQQDLLGDEKSPKSLYEKLRNGFNNA